MFWKAYVDLCENVGTYRIVQIGHWKRNRAFEERANIANREHRTSDPSAKARPRLARALSLSLSRCHDSRVKKKNLGVGACAQEWHVNFAVAELVGPWAYNLGVLQRHVAQHGDAEIGAGYCSPYAAAGSPQSGRHAEHIFFERLVFPLSTT